MYQTISMPEFEQLVKNETPAILDVREENEYEMGHIDGVQLIPLNTIPTNLAALNKEQPYYVICHSGMRSASACGYLAEQGYQVTNVMGGMSSWRGETVYGM